MSFSPERRSSASGVKATVKVPSSLRDPSPEAMMDGAVETLPHQ